MISHLKSYTQFLLQLGTPLMLSSTATAKAALVPIAAHLPPRTCTHHLPSHFYLQGLHFI